MLGAAMVAFTLLSFSSVFFAGVLALLWLAGVHWRLAPFARLLTLAAASVATAGGLYHVLWRYLHFDLYACSLVGVYFHHQQMRSDGFDSPGQWFMRSTCNLIAFALANLPLVGLAAAALASWKPADARRAERLVLPVTVLVIVGSAFSGKFYAETERIWALFLPWLAVGAGVELARGNALADDADDDADDAAAAVDARRVIVLMLLFAASQEILFVHGAF